MTQTQEERIISIIHRGDWVCAENFLANYMPRYSAVIWNLRHKRGYGIEGRKCQQHVHNGSLFEFRLTYTPARLQPKEQLSWC